MEHIRIIHHIRYASLYAFNGFYHNNKILSEPDEAKKASYIALISLTKSILEQCIDLLAIECPDRM